MNYYESLNIESDFTSKRKINGKKKNTYIEIPYGWSYKVNEQFNFNGLCKLINERDYSDF